MHTTGFGIYIFRQCLSISGAQLSQLSPIQNAPRKFNAFIGQIIQRAGIGAPCSGCSFLAASKPHFAEENFAQLFGRADVERLTSKFMNLFFHRLLLERKFR